MPSFYDLLKYAKTGIASSDMTAYDKMKAIAMAGGAKYPVTTITGVPPISFKADGRPLDSVSIIGNSQQTGAPTPDSPIMPEFVGERTENLVPPDLYRNPMAMQGVINDVSVCVSSPGSALYVIPASGGETYTIKVHTGDETLGVLRCGFIDVETPTPGLQVTQAKEILTTKNPTLTVTNSANKLYFVFQISGSYTDEHGLSTVMLNTGSTAKPYEPYGYKLDITSAGQTAPVYLGQVQTVRMIKKLVLNGSENWALVSVQDGNYSYAALNLGMVETIFVSGFGICTHFEYDIITTQTNVDGFSTISSTSTGYDRLAIRYKDKTARNDELYLFKQWLADQYTAGTPVCVWYVLATPQTGIVNEPLCKIGNYADELHSEDAGIVIPSVRGSNTLMVDTTVQPSSVTITGHIKPV